VPAVIQLELQEYAKKFPCKESWHNHQLSLGKYLPSIATYPWRWGIRRAFNDQCNFIASFIFY